MQKKRGGLPDPLYESPVELTGLAKDMGRESATEYLLFDAHIGRLRSADPILGDLTVMAREAVERLNARLDEALEEDAELVARAKAKAEAIRSTRVEGAVPEDQA